jgi:hypothetical protein
MTQLKTMKCIALILLAAAALAPNSSVLPAETPAAPQDAKPRATVTINIDAPALKYSPMIFGGFLEHFADQVYGDIFDPGSPLSDKNGFRRDVIKALKELRTPIGGSMPNYAGPMATPSRTTCPSGALATKTTTARR